MNAGSAAPMVVVANDHDVTRAAERVVLEYAGCVVSEARDGFDALALTLAEHPQILVLDLVLPGIDGRQLARMLRANASSSTLRVLALSASGESDDGASALAAGCDAFLPRPVSPHALVATIHALLDRE